MIVLAGAGGCAQAPAKVEEKSSATSAVPRDADKLTCMVASVHPLATDAGVAAFERGGNAVDAAIATALTLGVVDTPNSGIGGGCFILIRRADGTIDRHRRPRDGARRGDARHVLARRRGRSRS